MGNLAGDSPHIPHTSPISDCSYSHKWGIWGNLWGVPKITPHLSKPLYIGFSSNLGGISQKRYISKFLKIAFLCRIAMFRSSYSPSHGGYAFYKFWGARRLSTLRPRTMIYTYHKKSGLSLDCVISALESLAR